MRRLTTGHGGWRGEKTSDALPTRHERALTQLFGNFRKFLSTRRSLEEHVVFDLHSKPSSNHFQWIMRPAF